jgi:ABC-2 type transport system permease protein
MMTRLAAGSVPIWQLILSVLLFTATSGIIIRIAAGLFRAQNLLSGQNFRLSLLFKTLTGRA